jgi:hypothetical protein
VSWKCRWATRFNNFKKSFSHESRGDGGDTSELREIAIVGKHAEAWFLRGPPRAAHSKKKARLSIEAKVCGDPLTNVVRFVPEADIAHRYSITSSARRTVKPSEPSQLGLIVLI